MATTVRMKKRETAFSKPITEQVKSMEDRILEITNADYDCLYPTWDMLEDCYMGGGRITNAGDDVYLVKRLREEDDHYTMRKKRAKYYNKCKQVISTLHGHLWRKRPVRELPTALEDIVNNVDREGSDADWFFSSTTEWSMVYGPYYILVEYPKVIREDRRLMSADEERRLNLRPYFTKIKPSNLLDWRFTWYNGQKILDWIVIREEAEIDHQPFLRKEMKTRYKLYGRDSIEIWQYKDTPKGLKKRIAERIDKYDNTLGMVPLVPFWCDYIRFGVAKSALYDISMLNIEHYNKHSDKDNCEYYAGFPVHVFRGIGDKGKEIVVGEDHGVRFPRPESDFKIEEFKGTSIESLRKTEADIVMEIYDIAMKQVRDLSHQKQTAESKRLDKMDASSDLKRRAIGYADAESRCWQLAGMWMPTKVMESDIDKIAVTYNTDYVVEQIRADMIKALLDLNSMEKISDETLWSILKREELLSADFDAEEERQKIRAESNSKTVPDFSVIKGGMAEIEEE